MVHVCGPQNASSVGAKRELGRLHMFETESLILQTDVGY